MKIRTPKDVEKLDAKIKEELGIDVQKYRNEEVVESFVEILVFPVYVLNWVLRPVLVSLGIFILGFFLFDLADIEYIIYGVFGSGLFLTTGILIGLLFLIQKMKTDLWGIIHYSLEIMKAAVSDLKQVNHQITKENRKQKLGLLFKGIIHIVTIPVVAKVIANKVPLIGGLINGIIERILIYISEKVKFDTKKLNQELKKNGTESDAIQVYSSSISSASIGLEKVMNFTFNIVQLPIKIVLVLDVFILIFFLYLMN